MRDIKYLVSPLYKVISQHYCTARKISKSSSSEISDTVEAKPLLKGKSDRSTPISAFRRQSISALLLLFFKGEKTKRKNQITYEQVFNYVIFFAMLTSMVSFYAEFDKHIKVMEMQKENGSMQAEILERILNGESGERIPWPLIHRQITQIREGKQSISSLFSLYQHCKVYYPDDWLLLVEIGHILKDHTNQSLISRGRIKDPMGFRHEVLRHLIYLKHGKRPNLMENLHGNKKIQEKETICEEYSVENASERIPDEAKPILGAMIVDMQRSFMPSDGFVV